MQLTVPVVVGAGRTGLPHSIQLTTQKAETRGLAFTADGGLKKDYWKELIAQLNKK